MIENNFGDFIEIKVLKQSSTVIKCILIVSIFFLLIEALLWLSIGQRLPLLEYSIVKHLVLPITIFTGFLLFIFTWILNLKSIKCLSNGVSQNNYTLFNKGLKHLRNSYLLSLIILLICILSAVLEIILR